MHGHDFWTVPGTTNAFKSVLNQPDAAATNLKIAFTQLRSRTHDHEKKQA